MPEVTSMPTGSGPVPEQQPRADQAGLIALSAISAEAPRRSDTRWITTTVALLAIVVFIISGSMIAPSLIGSIGNGEGPDPRLTTAFLLNIALILFAWRRSVQLKETFAERDEAQHQAYNLAYYDEVTGLLNRRRLKELLAEACAKRVSKTAIMRELPAEKRLPNMTVLSIAPLLAEAIRRIHHGESVSELFAAHY